MPPDTPLLLEKPLLQILSNIVAGIHPPNPEGPSTLFEHFTRTRYSEIIRPEALKEWLGPSRISGALPLDTKENDSEPSLVFYNKVSRRLFEALTDQELAQLTLEYNEQWLSAKNTYEQAMNTMYAHLNIERIMDDIPDVLGMILTGLETLTNHHLVLWAGSASKHGISLINITGDNTQSEKPIYLPEAQKTIFEQMARQAMSAQQDAFINKCISMSALLPSSIFQNVTQKGELADKAESTNVQSGASIISPTSLDPQSSLPNLDGEHEGEQLTLTPSPPPPVTNALSSVPPSVGNVGSIISNIVVENEDRVSMTPKRSRTSVDPSSVLSTPTKRPRFTSTPSPSIKSLLYRRSPRNSTKARSSSISGSSPTTTMGPPPCTARTRSSWNTLITDSPHQTVNKCSITRFTPDLPTQPTSRDVSLPPIRCFGQLKAARRTSVPLPRLPLPAPSASSAVRLNPRDRPLPASCPAPIRTMIEKLPKSGSWMQRALSSILAVNIGHNYYRLVISLVDLESLYGFANGKRGPRSASRPKVLVKWINSGRTLSANSCVVTDVGAYARNWWKWWQTLQPEWRVFDKMGVPISVKEPTTFEAWNCLLVPGANGFLGVVASLYWWGCSLLLLNEKERKEEEGSWMRAVEDCTWVVESLVRLMKIRNETNMDNTIDYLHSDSDEDDDEDSEDEENELQELEVVC